MSKPYRMCSVEGCERKHVAKGQCHLHWQQEYRKTHPETWKKPKYSELPEELRQQYAAARRAKYYSCPIIREKRKNDCRKYRTGFSLELIAFLRTAQCNLCAICSHEMTPNQGPFAECADHCHTTKQPRGFLCSGCNIALGIYEKRQRSEVFRIEAYDNYIATPSVVKYGYEEDA